jgi:dynein assembly factor 3
MSTDAARVFIELYGNARVPASTWASVRKRFNHLIRYIYYFLTFLPRFDWLASNNRSITDKQGLLGQLVDVSQLKFRERDDIEAVFKFWDNDNKHFDIDKLW